MDHLEFLKSCYGYLRNPNKTLTVVLNIATIILVLNGSLLSNFSLQSLYKELSLDFLINISKFMIQSYFWIINILVNPGLILIGIIIVIFSFMAWKDSRFIIKYKNNIISAFLRLLKLYLRIYREVFLLMLMYAMIFWGEQFIGGLLNFETIDDISISNNGLIYQRLHQVVRDGFITETALSYIHFLTILNLIYSVVYIGYRLIRENKTLKLD